MVYLKHNDICIFQLLPHKNLKNYNNEKLVNGYSDFSKRIWNRLSFKNKQVTILPIDFINFKMYLSLNNISFYISCPADKKDYVKSKIESSWDKITVIQLANYPFNIYVENTILSELVYKRHDIFSLRTDKDITYPLRSMFNIANEMKDDEYVLIDIYGEPYKRHYWEFEANNAYNKFKKGVMPRKIINFDRDIGYYLGFFITSIFSIAHDLLRELIPTKQSKNNIVDTEVRILQQHGLSNSTLQKIHSEVLKTWIKVISHGSSIERAKILNSSITGTYKELATNENEFENYVVVCNNKKIDSIINCRYSLINTNSNKVSVHEWSKLSMIATADLQSDFKQIQNIQRIESSLPEELFQNEGIPLCKVTEKGVTRIARIPIYDHDVLCMPHLGFGMMRVGKSEGFGNNMAYHFILSGFSAFVLETNDGLSLDALRDSLPLDYPDEKIIEVDLGNLQWPIALSWNDSISRTMAGDEIEGLKVAEKLGSHIITFINNLSIEPFSEKMMYYLNAGKAVLQDPSKGLIDLFLALTSCSYREQLINEDYIKQQPEIYDILRILQQKSINKTDISTIEPILTRLTLLTGNKFLANLFLQPPILDKNGKPKLDFRRYMDNPEGGYGYCVLLRVPKAEFLKHTNTVASFLISKIWMCALSRMDTPKNKRKPFVFVADEPHQYIAGSGHLYEEAGVESGKYRMKLVWLAHSLSQFGEFKKALTDGGCQYTAYKTKTFKQFKELESEFKPFDIEELYSDLPKRWVAVNKIYLPKADDVPAFIGDMLPPPSFVKDRSYMRLHCSKEFGRPFKEVIEYVNKTRDRRKLDDEWMERMKEEKEEVEKEKRRVGKTAIRKPRIYR